MDTREELIRKLQRYGREDIIITSHALFRAIFRGIDEEEIKENIINPKRLHCAIRLESDIEGEEKYDCYFAYSNTQCQRYIIAINAKCVVCSVIKINRRWQRKNETKI